MKNKHLSPSPSPISSIDDLKSLAYEDGWRTLFENSEVSKNSNLVIDIRRDENERRHAVIYQDKEEEKSLHNLSDIHDISELNKKDDLHLHAELVADIGRESDEDPPPPQYVTHYLHYSPQHGWIESDDQEHHGWIESDDQEHQALPWIEHDECIESDECIEEC